MIFGRYVHRWLSRSWWTYVLSPREKSSLGVPWHIVAWCRATGHRGAIFYNPGGLEPDRRCKRCLEEVA